MSQVKVTIKPLGIAAAATAIVAIAAYGFFVRSQSTPDTPVPQAPQIPPAGKGAVGKLPTKNGAPGGANNNTGEGEQQESELMTRLNANPEQKRDWLVLGPLPSGRNITAVQNEQGAEEQMREIINGRYLPDEAKYQARENATVKVNGKSFTWRKLSGSAFDFRKVFESPATPVDSFRNVVVYGVTYIDSPKAQKKVIRFRSDDGAVVWVNGTQVYKATQIRGLTVEDMIPVTLRSGRNTILIKVGQGSGGWGMMVHLEDSK